MDGLFQWINQGIVNSTFHPVQSAIEQWLQAHRLVNFFVQHPLWLLGLFLIVVFLVSGALRAISRTSESLWILVLKFPFRVLGWLGFQGLAWWRKGRRDGASDRLQILLTRLETLREEQDAILAEVKTLVQQQPQNKMSTKNPPLVLNSTVNSTVNSSGSKPLSSERLSSHADKPFFSEKV